MKTRAAISSAVLAAALAMQILNSYLIYTSIMDDTRQLRMESIGKDPNPPLQGSPELHEKVDGNPLVMGIHKTLHNGLGFMVMMNVILFPLAICFLLVGKREKTTSPLPSGLGS
jgi:hypothetical protein